MWNDAERFWLKVQKTDSCWLWVGAKNPLGYGTFAAGSTRDGSRKFWRAHRWAYTMLIGPIPTGLSLDHLCRNPSCVRPEHLDPVSHRVNMLRGIGVAARNAVKKECPQGHPYDSENTYVTKTGGRICRMCVRIRVTHRKRLVRLGKPYHNPFGPEGIAPVARIAKMPHRKQP